MLDTPLTCPDGLVFDEAEHDYKLDGVVVPSVSRITHVVAPDLYAGIAEDIMQRAAARGHNKHLMIALDVRDNLDHGALSDEMLDDWSAWDQFRDHVQFDVEHSERCLASRKYKYAGTLDLAGTLVYKGSRDRWIIDAKFTAQLPSLVDIQLAAYRQAASESLPGYDDKTRRGCLWIRNGKYKFHEAKDRMDMAAVLAARTILHRRETL